jgi:hypothetical protein
MLNKMVQIITILLWSVKHFAEVSNCYLQRNCQYTWRQCPDTSGPTSQTQNHSSSPSECPCTAGGGGGRGVAARRSHLSSMRLLPAQAELSVNAGRVRTADLGSYFFILSLCVSFLSCCLPSYFSIFYFIFFSLPAFLSFIFSCFFIFSVVILPLFSFLLTYCLPFLRFFLIFSFALPCFPENMCDEFILVPPYKPFYVWSSSRICEFSLKYLIAKVLLYYTK